MARLVPTHRFKRSYKRARRNPRWRPIFNLPSHFEGTDLSPWEFILTCFLQDQPIPEHFYPHPITVSKKITQQIKASTGTQATFKVIDLHLDGHNGDHLLIYAPTLDGRAVILLELGTHAELFR